MLLPIPNGRDERPLAHLAALRNVEHLGLIVKLVSAARLQGLIGIARSLGGLFGVSPRLRRCLFTVRAAISLAWPSELDPSVKTDFIQV